MGAKKGGQEGWTERSLPVKPSIPSERKARETGDDEGEDSMALEKGVGNQVDLGTSQGTYVGG